MFINNPGHMTNMAAMPIYGKNPPLDRNSQRTSHINNMYSHNMQLQRISENTDVLRLIGLVVILTYMYIQLVNLLFNSQNSIF